MKKIVIFATSLMLMLTLSAISAFATALTEVNAVLNTTTKAVRITGKIDSGAGKQITIKIIGSNGRLEYLNETTSTEDGEFSFNYTMVSSITENYNVTLSGDGIAVPVITQLKKSSNITPTIASFNKKTSSQSDIAITMTLNGNTLNVIKNGTTSLTSNDYTVDGNSVIIKKSYLAGLSIGNTKLTFNFSSGTDSELSITVTDTTSSSGGSATVPSTGTTTMLDANTNNNQENSETSTNIINLSEQISSTDSEESKQELVDKAIVAIKDAGSTLSEDNQKASDSTLEILDAVIKINSSVSSPELVQEVANVAEKTIKQMTTQKIEANDPKVVLSSEQKDSLLEKIGLISQINEINNKLQQLGINNNTENKIILEVNTSSKSNVEVQLPTEVLNEAQSAGVDKIEILTPVAVISIPPSAISTDATAVSLGAKKVESSELTEEQQKAVGNSIVFDFNVTSIGEDGKTQKISQFNSDIEISIPYEAKEGEEPEKITIFFLNDNGQLENKMGIYNSTTKTVKFTTNHFSKYFIKYNVVTFKDIERVRSWAGKEIEAMASKGIINGREEGVFDPDASITRAEFIALITRSMKIVKSAEVTTFKDIEKTDWYYGDVASAQKLGILKIAEGKEFRPKDAITREEMAVFMARAMRMVKKINNERKLMDIVKFKDYKNIKVSRRKDVEYIVRNEIMQGMSETVFEPTGKATRAQAAVVIYRMWMK